MTVFACVGCDTALTVPVSRVALPAHSDQRCSGVVLGPLMARGTYAVDPYPFGPPWRPWAELTTDEVEARGWYVQRAPLVACGPAGSVVVAPGDVREAVVPGRQPVDHSGWEPDLACAYCGRSVATRVDEEERWHAVRFDPRAVHRVGADPSPPAGWDALCRLETPPIEPTGQWSPVWEAAVAVTLAHLLVASAGARLVVASGLFADVLRRPLDTLLPPGPPTLTVGLAGPGRPVTTDVAVVPLHPQTGEPWRAAEPARAVPLAFDVWAGLASVSDRRHIPGVGAVPAEVHRDDPPPPLPGELFRPDREVFLTTLARLPEVREPWLHDIFRAHRYRW